MQQFYRQLPRRVKSDRLLVDRKEVIQWRSDFCDTRVSFDPAVDDVVAVRNTMDLVFSAGLSPDSRVQFDRLPMNPPKDLQEVAKYEFNCRKDMEMLSSMKLVNAPELNEMRTDQVLFLRDFCGREVAYQKAQI